MSKELHDAIRVNNIAKVRNLLEDGEDPCYKDNVTGETALDIASNYCRIEIANILIRYIAIPTVNTGAIGIRLIYL